MSAKLKAALILARAMIENDRDVTAESFTIRNPGILMDADEVKIVAEYDMVLREIDAALAEVREAAWQRRDSRVTVSISGPRGSGKIACAHLFREALEAIGVEALVFDECDVTHAQLQALAPKVVIRTLEAVAHG
nr:hypothetical protein [uncultured Rhodopila sp.]